MLRCAYFSEFSKWKGGNSVNKAKRSNAMQCNGMQRKRTNKKIARNEYCTNSWGENTANIALFLTQLSLSVFVSICSFIVISPPSLCVWMGECDCCTHEPKRFVYLTSQNTRSELWNHWNNCRHAECNKCVNWRARKRDRGCGERTKKERKKERKSTNWEIVVEQSKWVLHVQKHTHTLALTRFS